MKLRYVLHPGRVTSKNDGQRHYITALSLADLYGVNLRDCTVVLSGEEDRPGYREQPGDIHLRPRIDGDYRLPRYALVHHDGCGQPAFLMVRLPEFGDRLDARDCRHLDGSSILPSDPVSCESCGCQISGRDLLPSSVVDLLVQ